MAHNTTLIDFNFTMNGFSMTDSQDLQDMLKRNKAAFDDERLREWRERKAMRAEDNALRSKNLTEGAAATQAQMEADARELREVEIDASCACLVRLAMAFC